MPANFLHGIETIDITDGPRTVRVVKTAIIGLVGTAPIWQAAPDSGELIETPRLCLSDVDDAKRFGGETLGFTIPTALRQIREQGRGAVIVVNVFDPARHKVAVAAASYTLPTTGAATGQVTVPHRGAAGLIVTSSDGLTTYSPATDYTHTPATGVIARRTTGTIPPGATLRISYDRPAPELVTAGDVIGTVDPLTGRRTGLQAFLGCHAIFGFGPMLLVAPNFGTLDTVAGAMDTIGQRLRAFSVTAAPVGTTVEQALSGRGPAGVINFATSNRRRVLPHMFHRRLGSSGTIDLVDPAPAWAGLCAENDIARGYWVSPSNIEVKGIVGLEMPISASLNDPNSEANLLNEAGIVTWFQSFGTGIRVWGNRSAAWPSDSHPTCFIAIQRTFDVIAMSVEQSLLPFLDRPLTPAIIDDVLHTVNSFVRKLISDGALIDGRYSFDAERNPTDQLAMGHLTLTADLTPPAPLERLTIEQRYDANGLKALYTALAA
ncbi:MAG: phage tail sheath family protein [Alphaproteobacteria bacterium]|nr:MAG: phage tail sheath family protein [Alphaproteobacteria bacterium]